MKDLNRFSRTRHGIAALLAAGVLSLATVPAQALDFYLGIGVGQSNANLDQFNNTLSSLDHKDTAWRVFGGVKASLLGAELGYVDFGKATDVDSEVHYKGISAFGLLYAPIPVPFLDIYAKAGLAKLNADIRNISTAFSTDDTRFAYGVGAQFKFASFAVRAEYEKYELDASKPSLLSLSAVYVF